MKLVTILSFILLISMPLALMFSCNKQADKNLQEAQQNVDDANQNVQDAAAIQAKNEWLTFKNDAEAKINANNKIIADYKLKMTNAKGKLLASYDRKIENLEYKNMEMRTKLAEYKDEGKDSWEKFKTEFNRDMDELGTSLKSFTTDSTK